MQKEKKKHCSFRRDLIPSSFSYSPLLKPSRNHHLKQSSRAFSNLLLSLARLPQRLQLLPDPTQLLLHFALPVPQDAGMLAPHFCKPIVQLLVPGIEDKDLEGERGRSDGEVGEAEGAGYHRHFDLIWLIARMKERSINFDSIRFDWLVEVFARAESGVVGFSDWRGVCKRTC